MRQLLVRLLFKNKGLFFPRYSSSEDSHTRRFVEENIRTTRELHSPWGMSDVKVYGFEAFVVGSDQVWRNVRHVFLDMYTPRMFLDFLGGTQSIRRIAYAASLGIDRWEFSSRMTQRCAGLAKQFHAISVREDSGVLLCKKYLGVHAEHVIDPTMLLSKEDYCAIVARDEARGFLEKRVPAKRLFAYVLDESPEKKNLINSVAETLGLAVDEIMPKREEIASGAKAYPPVSAWLRGVRDAEFVVTDSFHGCVFSIIFNKPFIAIGNLKRGMARFRSLLKMFGLENRLISPDESLNVRERICALLSEKIDWGKINAIRSREQAHAKEFLVRSTA